MYPYSIYAHDLTTNPTLIAAAATDEESRKFILKHEKRPVGSYATYLVTNEGQIVAKREGGEWKPTYLGAN